jgi:hypothetical protein
MNIEANDILKCKKNVYIIANLIGVLWHINYRDTVGWLGMILNYLSETE